MKKASKIKDMLFRVRRCVESANYIYTQHARNRMIERSINRDDVIEVLLNGYHEKAKDTFDFVYCCWNYAIRGKADEVRNIRVVVSFDNAGLLVITVIDLG